MSNNNTPSPEGAREHELSSKLRELMGDDVGAIVDLELPEPVEPTEARRRHNARTALYKSSVAQRLAPDSEAVAQACFHMLLHRIESAHALAPEVVAQLTQELVDAGYDAGQCELVIARLLHNVRSRRETWQRRTRQRLGWKLREAILEVRKAIEDGR